MSRRLWVDSATTTTHQSWRDSLIWFYIHNVLTVRVLRRQLRGSDAGNSRQHSVSDCLAARSRRQQELIIRLPRSVSYRRHHLPALCSNSVQVPLWCRLVLYVLCGSDIHRCSPWTSACSQLLSRTFNRHSSPITGMSYMYTVGQNNGTIFKVYNFCMIPRRRKVSLYIKNVSYHLFIVSVVY